MMFEFTIIDNRTRMYPDCEKIALTEEWARHLVYCDIDCFAITEDGTLILIDDCNNVAYPPADRFTVTLDAAYQRNIPMNPTRKNRGYYSDDYCPVCGKQQKKSKRNREIWFCERCGQKLSWDGFNPSMEQEV